MLTPMDIHDHQFKKSFRGYNENEVDDFLDRVVDDFEKLLRENERLKNQVYANDKELEHYRKLEKTLNDTLMVAQRTAREKKCRRHERSHGSRMSANSRAGAFGGKAENQKRGHETRRDFGGVR